MRRGRGCRGVNPAHDAAHVRHAEPPAAWRQMLRGRAVGPTVVLLLAGLLFGTSAHEARGTSLRTDRVDGSRLYQAELARRDAAADRVQELNRRIAELTATAGRSDSTVSGLQGQVGALEDPVGMHPVRGETVTVSLDDAPTGRVREGFRPDELVVHQQDVQAVVNALWAGGAQAISLMGQRVIATTAVRCVGNTLLLHGRLYSPPYVVVAVGSPDRLQQELDRSPDVALYREYQRQVGLKYSVRTTGVQVLPGYVGSPVLEHATPVGPAGMTP